MTESRRLIGPIVVLVLSAVLVMCLFAYGTANNWFAFATGDVYKADDGAVAPASPSEAPTSTGSPSAGDGDYQSGFDRGRKDGFKRGYIRGRKDGYKHGYAVGVNKGMKITHDQGYQAGYPAGEKAGRKAGAKKLEQDYQAWRASR